MSEIPGVLEAIYRRRSIRKFQDKAVEHEKILELLKAAQAAPSAVNSQPWEFVVVSEAPNLDRLREQMEYGHYRAPVIIVVCGSPATARNPSGETYWLQDCSAAIENILLAAVGLGLGSVWVAVYPRAEKIETVRRIVNLPDGVTPLALIYTGYPAEEKPPHTLYDEKRVHWQHYQEQSKKASAQ
jgi:nitroreductase